MIDTAAGTSRRGDPARGVHRHPVVPTLDGEPVLARVRFFDIEPESFEWENRVSLDGGASWYRDSTISARRSVARAS